jgi:hypothetical protein
MYPTNTEISYEFFITKTYFDNRDIICTKATRRGIKRTKERDVYELMMGAHRK